MAKGINEAITVGRETYRKDRLLREIGGNVQRDGRLSVIGDVADEGGKGASKVGGCDMSRRAALALAWFIIVVIAVWLTYYLTNGNGLASSFKSVKDTTVWQVNDTIFWTHKADTLKLKLEDLK